VVELHGNLAHNARTRNLAAFASGAATTLVATDIAARGLHVDEVELVVHADPPVEHKAYLHRSGRTARAGASGTVVTLMTDAQRAEVRDLARKAGITPTTTRLAPGDPLLSRLAPGERVYADPAMPRTTATEGEPDRSAERAQGGRKGDRQAVRQGVRQRDRERSNQPKGGSQAKGGQADQRAGSQTRGSQTRGGSHQDGRQQQGGLRQDRHQSGAGAQVSTPRRIRRSNSA
jgi:superfamily II DNA/RNA helicase